MFHVKPADGAVEHFGGHLEPDWRVENRPDGTWYWIVVDWHGETIAHGVTTSLGEGVANAVKYST